MSVTIPLNAIEVERLRSKCDTHSISQAKFIACVLMLEDEEIASIIQRTIDAVCDERTAIRKDASSKRRSANEIVKSLTREEINAILEARKGDAK